MNLCLSGIRLDLFRFTLNVDVVLRSRATAIFGPSGAGKTSLLEIIAGLRRPHAGEVSLDGEILTDVAGRRFVSPQQRAFGYVPQEGALFPHLSVRKNLCFGYKARDEGSAVLTYEHVVEVLEISHLLERNVLSLSGGEQRRVAFGRALLCAPSLLLLDEPLAGLDSALKERLLPYLKTIRDTFGIPMLYITHSADEVMELCDDVLLLEQGEVTEHGPPETLFIPSEKPQYRLR